MISKLLTPNATKIFLLVCLIYLLQGNLECRKTIVFHPYPNGINSSFKQVESIVKLSSEGNVLRQSNYKLIETGAKPVVQEKQIANLGVSRNANLTFNNPLLTQNNN